MATPTYDLIDSVVLSSSAATVAFSSITQSYQDLVLVTDLTSDTASMGAKIRLNGYSGSTDYWYTSIATSSSGTRRDDSSGNGINMNFASITTSTRTKNVHTFFNYADSTWQKQILWRLNEPFYTLAGTWRFYPAAGAITSISCEASTDAFGVGSTFYLYGIAG